MRLIGKLLALPFVLVTGILYLVCKFLVVVSGAVLGILSGIVFLAALALFFAAGFWPGLSWLVIAFLISPYGLPMAAGGDHRRRKQRVKGFRIWLNSFGGAHWQPRPFSIIMAVCYGSFLIGGI